MSTSILINVLMLQKRDVYKKNIYINENIVGIPFLDGPIWI